MPPAEGVFLAGKKQKKSKANTSRRAGNGLLYSQTRSSCSFDIVIIANMGQNMQ